MKEVPCCLPPRSQASKQSAPFTCLAVPVLFPSAQMQSRALYTTLEVVKAQEAHEIDTSTSAAESVLELIKKTISNLTMLKFS